MEIVWFGHSCFRLKGKEVAVVTDPFNKTLGYPMKKLTANIVTVSHDHPQHNNVESVGNNPRIVNRPGEYEIANVFINGITTYHDSNEGETRGKNTAFRIEIEDLRICHLGDLGHVPSPDQIEQMSGTDILIVPVGGISTIDAAQAAETVTLISPKIIIPMHYKTDVVTNDLELPERFLKEMGQKEVVPQAKLSVSKSHLPAESTVIVLNYN